MYCGLQIVYKTLWNHYFSDISRYKTVDSFFRAPCLIHLYSCRNYDIIFYASQQGAGNCTHLANTLHKANTTILCILSLTGAKTPVGVSNSDHLFSFVNWELDHLSWGGSLQFKEIQPKRPVMRNVAWKCLYALIHIEAAGETKDSFSQFCKRQ